MNLKIAVIAILLLKGFNSFGQYYNGIIVTENGDTVSCEIFLPNYLNGQLNYSTMTKRITTKKDGKIHIYKPTEIKLAELQVSENDKPRFVSIPEDRKQFFQEKAIGKLSLFTLHLSNSGFPAPILRKEGKLTFLNVINKKARVTNLISDYPSLCNDWEAGKYEFNELKEVVKMYNEYFENTK